MTDKWNVDRYLLFATSSSIRAKCQEMKLVGVRLKTKAEGLPCYQVTDLQNSPKGVVDTKILHRLQRRLSRYLDRELLRVSKETETALG